MADNCQVDIGEDTIKFDHYPFKPSTAYSRKTIHATEIGDCDPAAWPPTIRVANDLIFITAEKKEELKVFAERNRIKLVNRPDIWSWILEPFLDTEFTEEDSKRINVLLLQHGLPEEIVTSLRKRVSDQMMTYNFDTGLWEWVNLNAWDVLKAMKTKYNPEEYHAFYELVMKIALIAG